MSAPPPPSAARRAPLNKPPAPSPPPKPAVLSPLPPRRPMSISNPSRSATIPTESSYSATSGTTTGSMVPPPPIPIHGHGNANLNAFNPSNNNHNNSIGSNNNNNSSVNSNASPPVPAPRPGQRSSLPFGHGLATSPSTPATPTSSQQQLVPPLPPPSTSTFQRNFGSAPSSSNSSPANLHASTFYQPKSVHPLSPSAPGSSSLPGSNRLQYPPQQAEPQDEDVLEDDPFNDPSNIQEIPTSMVARTAQSLLTMKLQGNNTVAPSPNPRPLSTLLDPLSTSTSSSSALSPPSSGGPPIVPPPRTRSPLAALQQQQPLALGLARQSTMPLQRHSLQPAVGPSSSSLASPTAQSAHPARRTSVQMTASSPMAPIPGPRMPSVLYESSGPSTNNNNNNNTSLSAPVSTSTRFRNLTAPHPIHGTLSPQTPKRVFSTSSSSSPNTASVSPQPDRLFPNAEWSDSPSDSDESSADSDEDWDTPIQNANSSTAGARQSGMSYGSPIGNVAVSPAANPFLNNEDTQRTPAWNPRPAAPPPPAPGRQGSGSGAGLGGGLDVPPSLPSRPTGAPRNQFARPSHSISDQDTPSSAPPPPPTLMPKPSRRPNVSPATYQDQHQLDEESNRTNLPTPTFSSSNGVFPDYSRSNRRQPLFAEVMGIHDIQQKSHGVKAFSISNEQVATATNNTRIYSLFTGDNISSFGHEKDSKPTAVLFTQSRRPEHLGQFLWVGGHDGTLQVIDTKSRQVLEKRMPHKGNTIIHIIRCRNHVYTIDDSGVMMIWIEDTLLGRPTIQGAIQTMITRPKQTSAIAVQDQLWSSDGMKLYIFNVKLDNIGIGQKALSPPAISANSLSDNRELDIPHGIGALTCLATIPGSGHVFSGHEDGKVVVWSIAERAKVRVINVHAYRIMSMLGVGHFLWTGFSTGKIYVLDTRPETPVVLKDWQAHKDSGVSELRLDEECLIMSSRLQVGSCGENGEIKVWDGLMGKDSFTKGMMDRSKEYCNYRDLRVLICSWNIDASKPTALDANGGSDRQLIEAWLTGMSQDASAGGPPDIIKIGFQEIVDLESKKMTAKSLLKGSKRAESEKISKQYKRWQIFLTKTIRDLYQPKGVDYKLIECANLVGLFSCVFVRDKEMVNVRQDWTHVDMVKTGLGGLHGNKGGIATRLIIDDSSIAFVNVHLAAGQSHTQQRNTDAANVLRKLQHPNPSITHQPVHPEVFWFGDGTLAMDHEVCFLSGDLNYRIDLKFKDTVDLVQAQEWGELQANDQLLLQRVKNPQFILRGFQEQELRFAPTYKYDPGTDTYDTSSKHRTPAWCDRILWRGRHIRPLFYRRCECRVSDHRPITGGFVVAVKKIDEMQRRVVEKQVQDVWKTIQDKEIRFRKLSWLRSWGWSGPQVESLLQSHNGDLGSTVAVLMGEA